MIGQTGIYIRLTVGELEGLVREQLGDHIEWMEFESLLAFEDHMSLLKLRYSSYKNVRKAHDFSRGMDSTLI